MHPYLSERANTTRLVKEMMIRQLNLQQGPDQIDNDAPLFGMGLGLDSVDALELIVGLEQEFNVVIPEQRKTIFHSVNGIVDYLMEFRTGQEPEAAGLTELVEIRQDAC